MNNLPLQPLVWSRTLTTKSAFHQYLVRKDDEATKRSKSQYVVNYGRLNTQKSMNIATGFATIDEAKQWAWNHYNEKMQPYVKPSPTWIDVNERLPEEDGLYFTYYPDQLHERQITFFSLNIKRFNLFHDLVTHWMPLPNPPEFSTMQNMHKGEVTDD